MPTAAQISEAEFATADAIHTIDPNDRNAAGHQLWGNRSKESQALTETDETILEIELPSDDHVGLLALIHRIERAKGRLPPDVDVLRRNLSS